MKNAESIAAQGHTPDSEPKAQPSEADIVAAAITECEQYLGENAASLGALFGLRHFRIKVGKKWGTNPETGEVTAGIEDYLRQGYTPDMATHDILHEVAAHLRQVEFAPKLTREIKAFTKDSDPQLHKAKHIFHNIFSDIAGNKLVYATLPTMRDIAVQLYGELIFTEDDFTGIPRHLQFLYKIMRQEMIPDSQTAALPEVDAMIDEFRDYQGKGDLISYSTQVAKSRTEAMPVQEQFDIWTKVIYPRWRELYNADREDPEFQKQPSQPDQQSESGESQPDDSNPQPDKPGSADFSDYYQHYSEALHPEPIDHKTMDKLKEVAGKQQSQEARDQRKKDREAADRANPEKQLDAQICRETGHSLAEKRRYNNEILTWRQEIAEMRGVYRSIINEHTSSARYLRGNHTEGAMLNPETLVQTYIDVRTGHPEPPAYADYETREAERRLAGKTDYVFVFDRSGSMQQDGRAEAAASSLVICLESLAGMQRDIREAERQAGVEVDLDIRTAVYTFNHEIHETKPLSPGLSDKERLDSYALVSSASENNADSHVLALIEKMKREPDRRQILIFVCDGEADDVPAARASILRLRKDGWTAYGVSINSDAAVTLFAPDSERVNNPAELPQAMKNLVGRTLM